MKMLRLVAVIFLLFFLFFWSVSSRSCEECPDPEARQECEEDGGIYSLVNPTDKDPNWYDTHPNQCPVPQCRCLKDGDSCPLFLPTLGKKLQLAKSTLPHEYPNLTWEKDVGFGSRAVLNILNRFKISDDRENLHLFLPAHRNTLEWVKEGESYKPGPNALGISFESRIIFLENGRAVLKMPTGLSQIYEPIPGEDRLYRMISMHTPDNYSSHIRYEDSRIVYTDASSQEYICHFDDQRRIVSINIAGREWQYEYQGTSVEEIAPDGYREMTVLDANGKLLRREYRGKDNTRQIVRYEYDADGVLIAGFEGSRHIRLEEVKQDGLRSLRYEADGIIRKEIYNAIAKIGEEKGKDGRAHSTSSVDA